MILDLYSPELKKQIADIRAEGKSIVMLSGGVSPIHSGHIKMIQDAKKRFPEHVLVFVVNCDDFLARKKGFVFLPLEERAFIVDNIKGVDLTVTYETESQFVHEAILEIVPDVFCQGGDRSSIDSLPEEEVWAMGKTGCKLECGIGGENKSNSSSWLVEDRFIIPELFFTKIGHPAKTEEQREKVMTLAESLANIKKLNLWTMNYYSPECRIGLSR